MSTLDHNFNDLSAEPAKESAGKTKYPPPFSHRSRSGLPSKNGPDWTQIGALSPFLPISVKSCLERTLPHENVLETAL